MLNFFFGKSKNILVIEVSKARLKIAAFLRTPTKLKLLGYSFTAIDPAGDDAKAIVRAIRDFFKENPLAVKDAVLSIADADSVAMKYCLLPVLKREEVLSAAVWQLKDEVHFDLNNAYSDWRVVKEITDEDGARQQGIIFAFSQKEAVEKYLTCLAQCNLRASAVVTNAFSYVDVLRGIAEDKQISSEIILDLEYSDSALNLYVNKELHFTRYLPVSVESFTRSLVGTLVSDKGRVELTMKEAEQIRDNIGIPQDETVFIKENLQASQIASLIRPVLESLVRETKHSVTYFTGNLNEAPPQAIYLAGLGANLKNLDTYLAEELKFPVTKLSLPGNLDTSRISASQLDQDRAQLLSCVGAVLSAGRGVSLMAGDVKMRWLKNIFTKHLKPIFLVAVGLVVAAMLVLMAKLPYYSYRLKAAKGYFQDKKVLLSFFQKVQRWQEVSVEVSMQRVTADALLNFISQTTPAGLRLSELTLDQYEGTLILKGDARDAGQVQEFLEKLKGAEYFSAVETVGPQGQNFYLKCKLKY